MLGKLLDVIVNNLQPTRIGLEYSILSVSDPKGCAMTPIIANRSLGTTPACPILLMCYAFDNTIYQNILYCFVEMKF